MPGFPRPTASSARWPDRSLPRALRSRGLPARAARIPQRAVPDLSRDPPRTAALPAARGAQLAAFAPQAIAHRDRGTARVRGATLVHAAQGCASRPPITRSFRSTCDSRLPIPLSSSYAALRWFHGGGHALHGQHGVGCRANLHAHGFSNLARWPRGVDTELFRPRTKDFLALPRPIAAYVGRVAVEKNIGAFLHMPWVGTKIVIGDGPERPGLQAGIRRRCTSAIGAARISRRTSLRPT